MAKVITIDASGAVTVAEAGEADADGKPTETRWTFSTLDQALKHEAEYRADLKGATLTRYEALKAEREGE